MGELGQVGEGWLDGPFPYDEDGRLLPVAGPQLANPASRFGFQLGKKQGASDDLKRSQINRAAAIQTPVNPPTWGYFAAIGRTYWE